MTEPNRRSWTYATPRGTFRITFVRGRWHPLYGDESLGPYRSPSLAAYALANGECVWPSCGDPATLGIPETLDGWTPAGGP